MKRVVLIYLLIFPLICIAQNYSGTTGDCTWKLDTSKGVMTISGKGKMESYTSRKKAPWYPYRSSIKRITFTNSVTIIGAYSFYGCRNLRTINFPSSLREIKGRAFFNCYSLHDIDFPKSLRTIGTCAFNGCSSLTSISIPSSVKLLGAECFVNCPSLDTLFIDSESITTAESGIPYHINGVRFGDRMEFNNLMYYFGKQFKVCILGSNITEIRRFFLDGCLNITTLYIPKNLKFIGLGSIDGCRNLKKIIIPDLDTWLNIEFEIDEETIFNSPMSYGGGLYLDDDTEITNIILPPTMETISAYRFQYMRGLKSITFPQNLTRIEREAFRRAGVKELTFPSSTTFISYMAFEGCQDLETVTFNSTEPIRLIVNSFANCKNLKLVISHIESPLSLPEGVDSPFYSISKDCTLYIPSGSMDNYIDAGWDKIFGNRIFEMDPSYTKSVYAVYDKNTLTFYKDNQENTREGEIFQDLTRNSSKDQWGKYKSEIIKVVFDPSFSRARPQSTAHWFNGCYNLENIVGIENLNTSNVTSMYAMFNGMGKNSSKMIELDISNFNTSNVTNMAYMFNCCTNIQTIYIGEGWDTKNIDSSTNMFYNCKNLIGGDGTTYYPNYTDKTRAFAGLGGYLTYKSSNSKERISDDFPSIASEINNQKDEVTSNSTKIYTIQGQLVGLDIAPSSLKKGIYLINGKKVIIR